MLKKVYIIENVGSYAKISTFFTQADMNTLTLL